MPCGQMMTVNVMTILNRKFCLPRSFSMGVMKGLTEPGRLSPDICVLKPDSNLLEKVKLGKVSGKFVDP